jgi:hypothetical protein
MRTLGASLRAGATPACAAKSDAFACFCVSFVCYAALLGPSEAVPGVSGVRRERELETNCRLVQGSGVGEFEVAPALYVNNRRGIG